MLIERDIRPFVILETDPISVALDKISKNKSKYLICVSDSGVLVGTLTDGDIRRSILKNGELSLTCAVSNICNKNSIFSIEGNAENSIRSLLSDKIYFVPIVNQNKQVVAVANAGAYLFRLGGKRIGEGEPCFIIAEIGINHNGSYDLAIELIDKAVQAGADCAKFQMRDMDEMYLHGADASNPNEDLGSQYILDIISSSMLPNQMLLKALDYCRSKGIIPLCTAWDQKSVKVLEDYGIDGYKIASADLTNHNLLHVIADCKKPIIMSTGMSTENEIKESVSILRRRFANFSLLHCNSTYPVPFKDINLCYMDRLRELSGGIVGYSGHERGYSIALAAVARGAKIIEKHFTLDRSMIGNDHKVSLEPQEFKSMVEGIRAVEDSLGQQVERQIGVGERLNREVLAKSLVASCHIEKDTVITDSMIAVSSPGKGIQPNRRNELIGRRANRAYVKGDFFFESELVDAKKIKRDFKFNRPLGIPVRYHDWLSLSRGANLDFLEFHFSYRDLELSIDDFFTYQTQLGLVTHSPDLFAGDHLLNLASSDKEYLTRSIYELQRVINVTRELSRYFRVDKPVPIIASLGGFSTNNHLEYKERVELYDRVTDSLSKLDQSDVEILPQTLPPFPWYFGGQLYCNIFVDCQDIKKFCEQTGYRICFDVSHSKLASNFRNQKFEKFSEVVAPFVAHLHIVDAAGIDKEGLQIFEGEIDFFNLAQTLNRFCPNAGFIPEIWQGHKDSGRAFWIALERLQNIF